MDHCLKNIKLSSPASPYITVKSDIDIDEDLAVMVTAYGLPHLYILPRLP